MIPTPPLLLITDRLQARHPLPEVVAAALAAGCRWISLREKDLTPSERVALVTGLLPLARRYGARLTVHGDLEAAALGDGVHLPDGGDVAAARALLGADRLVGLSCHAPAEAAASTADYVTLSPIYPSPSKPGHGPALGPAALSEARSAARSEAAGGPPVLALGGVTADRVGQCLDAGAAGIAVMGEVMRAVDPGAVVSDLLRALAAARP